MALQQPCVRSLAAIAKRRLADKYDAALKAGYAENVEEYATTCPGIWALTGVLWSHAARPVVPPGQDTVMLGLAGDVGAIGAKKTAFRRQAKISLNVRSRREPDIADRGLGTPQLGVERG